MVVRGVMSKILRKESDIEVIGTATDPYQAREMILELKPDVITLDIEMPKMDGLTFLKKLMKHHPVRVVICSSLTLERADLAMRATDLGALEVISKPRSTEVDGLKEIAIELVDKVRAASQVMVRRRAFAASEAYQKITGLKVPGTTKDVARIRGIGYAKANVIQATPELKRNSHKVIAIGASTGGTEALRVVLERLPKETPPIVIVQHMPEFFTQAFANRLNGLCEIEVKEATNGDRLRPGLALVAPGGKHMMLRRAGVDMAVEIKQGPLVCRHRPSVEVLFNSVAKVAGGVAVGVMLTGMGGDGADAMANMKHTGAKTIAQDEASSVVFGMPKEAIKRGCVDRIEHLERISQAIIDFCSKR